MGTLKDLLVSKGIELTPEEEQAEVESSARKARIKGVLERPKEEFVLKSVSDEAFERKKNQKDPTDDLIEVTPGVLPSEALEGAYFVFCSNTRQAWVCPTKECLDANFIYRKDLDIYETKSKEDVLSAYEHTIEGFAPGVLSRRKCYILDNPACETYEVYYESSYPSVRYGKATPNGMFVHCYDNRFHRDMAIMELDSLYSSSPRKAAAALVKQEFKANEAIIISDGCWMRESCSAAFYYIDKGSLIRMVEGFLPSEGEQAVLISEVKGATNALAMCRAKGKKRIKYYYDNTSILNVFRNRKTEYIEEIKAYKDLLEQMDSEGYHVEFIELHPKTGEENAEENPALMFFHNYADKDCREMSEVFSRGYKDMAASGGQEGKSYQDVKKEFKPKGRPGQGGGNKGPQNNSRNGNNKYGKRF